MSVDFGRSIPCGITAVIDRRYSQRDKPHLGVLYKIPGRPRSAKRHDDVIVLIEGDDGGSVRSNIRDVSAVISLRAIRRKLARERPGKVTSGK